jgi:hypothetical protein
VAERPSLAAAGKVTPQVDNGFYKDIGMTTNSVGSVSSLIMGSLQQALSAAGTKGQSTAQFAGVVTQMESRAGETTVTKPDGSSVTTIKGADGKDRIVSESSASGESLTEVGYVSPVLMQRFLDSLTSALQADGAGAAATIASTDTAAAATVQASQAPADNAVTDTLGNSLQALIGQLGSNAPISAANSNLMKSFDDLMQGSGIPISVSAGQTSGRASDAALQSFLKNAMPPDSEKISTGQTDTVNERA